MMDWREYYEPEPREWWCLVCGLPCHLTRDGDERGSWYETTCCGSTDYSDTPPWCSYCENVTVADDQLDDAGERMCLACAWTREEAP